MSGDNFPSNPSTSDLLSGLPPHGSSFLPKAEAIKASAGCSSHEVEDSTGPDSKSHEWQHQKNHPVRYQVAGYGSNSILGRYKPPNNSPSNKNSGSQPYGRNCLSDPYRGQINGGQPFYNPLPALIGGWVPPRQEPPTATILLKSNNVSTDQALRVNPSSTAFCFHCDGYDHETRNCEKASASKQALKRKQIEEKLNCCEIMDPCRHHAKKFPSLVTATREGRTCAEECPISEWGTGSNAVPQGIGRKVLFASTPVGTNLIVAGTSTMEQASQDNIGIQMNTTNSEESGTLVNDCRLGGSANESVPSTSNTDEWNISSSQSSIVSQDGFCGLKDTRNGMQNDTEKSEKDNRDCNLCKLTEGRHMYGCLNSKKFRFLQSKPEHERIKRFNELVQKKKRRSEYLSLKATKGIRKLFPVRRVEPPPPVPVTLSDEQQFLVFVDSIKGLPRTELEQLVIAHMFSCERNKQNQAKQLELAKQMAYDFQERINLAKQIQKRENRKKEKLESRIRFTVGTQTESMIVPCQKDFPLTVHSPAPSFIKVEMVTASTSAEELSASNEDHSDYHRLSLTIGNAHAVQYDPAVSHDTITTALQIGNQSMSMPYDSSSQPENRVEPLEIRKSTTTNPNAPSAPSAGHHGTELPPLAGPSTHSIEHFQSSMARPSTSTRSEILGFVSAHQPSALYNAYQLPYVSSYGNQQRGRQNVQWDPRLVKLETVKVEANEATGAPIQRIKVEPSGSRELPIEIE